MQIIHGKERTEEEWKNIFHETGLCDYKIFSFTGYLSLIENNNDNGNRYGFNYFRLQSLLG
ncbi:hypothetical protein Ahy_A04g017525 [Arachis hypogaea]|uniref:Uncharacterized protein n=1 Tax=Arachis hypogaea TaxID=3818 RepID=A0A445DBB2_ARAHY|nr:hypothetical protein Ahy_A04g017525 [Arachis hypogaea]